MNFEKIRLNELKIEPRQFLCAIQEPRDGHVNASLGQLRHDKKRKMEIKRSACRSKDQGTTFLKVFQLKDRPFF